MRSESINESINLSGQYQDKLLSYHGSIIGGIELSGVDPASVSDEMLVLITEMIKRVLDLLPVQISLSSYYIHYEGEKILTKQYSDPKVKLLLDRRSKFLNEKQKLNSSHLFWVLEHSPFEDLNKIKSLSFVKNLFNSLFDKEARKKIKIACSAKSNFIAEDKALTKMRDNVHSFLRDIDAKLSYVSFENELLDNCFLWKLNRFLVNFNKEYLFKDTPVPIDDWDKLLADGDIAQIMFKGHELLKISGAKPIYLKIAHITQFGGDSILPGIWAAKKSTPVLNSGDYVYFTRFTKLSEFERAFMFKSKRDALERSQLSFSDIMKNVNPESQINKKLENNLSLKKDLMELEEKNSSGEDFCYFCSAIVLFNEDPEVLIKSIDDTNRLLTDNMRLIWENPGLLNAYKRIQMGHKARSYRDFKYSLSQASASSLLYRSYTGRKNWGLYKNEFQYVFESIDKTPFYYSSYVNEKNLVVAVGPTRSGKSFLRNVLASHFKKYKGIYIAIDVDAGTETLAQYYKEDSAIFKLPRKEDKRAGFNPIALSDGINDNDWRIHFSALIRDLLKLNDSDEMKSFTQEEQQNFDKSVEFALIAKDNIDTLPQSLSTIASMAGEKVRIKLSRFLRGGQFGHIFDNDYDAVGTLNKPISIYNLAAVKDNAEILSLCQREILFRVIRLFEDPNYLSITKILDMDECQYTFKIKETVTTFEEKVRTWFKNAGGAQIWTQSPEHYHSMPGWGTIAASASTFLFLPDYKAVENYENYNKAFGLTKSECELIAGLTRQKQVYIKQPDIDVSKVVNLNVEAEQYIICTSTAEEMAIRNEVMERMEDETDFNIVISEIIKQINLKLGKNLEETR